MALYIVATPIGNLEDITLRALRMLKEVELILAEDTRRISILLKHYEIKNKRIVSFNDFNKEKKTPSIVRLLKNNKEIALVSDAGTPGISDPGFYLVRECVKEGIKVVPIPGASSIISALVASGLPTDRFSFYGFLPKKEKRKREIILEIKSRKETACIFESPYRVLDTLQIISEIMSESDIVIAREMTKKFEEFIRGKAKDVYKELQNKKVKGEIVMFLNAKI